MAPLSCAVTAPSVLADGTSPSIPAGPRSRRAWAPATPRWPGLPRRPGPWESWSPRAGAGSPSSRTGAWSGLSRPPTEADLGERERDIQGSEHGRLHDFHRCHRPVARIGLHPADLVHHIHPLHHLPEDRVLGVEVRVIHEVDEKLASPRVRAGVRHGDGPPDVPVVRGELVADGIPGATPAGARGIAALDHEVADDPVEDGPVVVSLAGEFREIARRDGHIGPEFEGDVTHGGLKPHELSLGWYGWCRHGRCPVLRLGAACCDDQRPDEEESRHYPGLHGRNLLSQTGL